MRNDNTLWVAVEDICNQLVSALGLDDSGVQLRAYISGDVGVNYYTQESLASCLNMSFSSHILLSNDIVSSFADAGGKKRYLKLKREPGEQGFTHPDYALDASFAGYFGKRNGLMLYVLSPVDIVVGKIVNLCQGDMEGILSLYKIGVLDETAIADRVAATLKGYVGGQDVIHKNLQDVLSVLSVHEAFKDISNITPVSEKQLLAAINDQAQDYRDWEENLFRGCCDFMVYGTIGELLSFTEGLEQPDKSKLQYLACVMAWAFNVGINEKQLTASGCAPLETAFFSSEYRPGRHNPDKLCSEFGLQRGLMMDRFRQFVDTGSC